VTADERQILHEVGLAVDRDALAAPGPARDALGRWGKLTGGSLSPCSTGSLAPLADGVTEVAAEVLYARDREWALTADDVLRRRTTLALTGETPNAVRARIETLLAS
jgi:hypothetical protein